MSRVLESLIGLLFGVGIFAAGAYWQAGRQSISMIEDGQEAIKDAQDAVDAIPDLDDDRIDWLRRYAK